MLLHKRIRKPPQNTAIQYPTKVKRPKISAAKRKLQRCTYQAIPPSSKFPANSKIYNLYGDMIALEVQDELHFDFSLWNQCKSLQQIKVMDLENQKLVVLDLIQLENDKILPWEKALKKLKNKKENNLLEWNQLIQDFSLRYGQFDGNETNTNFQESIDAEFELDLKQRDLLRNSASFMVRSILEEGKPRISELLFTEKFIKEVEHSVDSFVSLILQDGIPQFTPKNDTAHSLIQKALVKNYLGLLENENDKIHFSQLLTKDSHMKDVKTQVYLFSKKLNGKPAIDVIYVILESSISEQQQQLFVKGRKALENKIYKEKLQRRETETSHFLMSYYQEFMPKPIANLDKVCGIKELPPPPEDEEEEEETDDCYIGSMKSESL